MAKKVTDLISYGRRGCLARKPRCEGLGKAKQVSTEAIVIPRAHISWAKASNLIVGLSVGARAHRYIAAMFPSEFMVHIPPFGRKRCKNALSKDL